MSTGPISKARTPEFGVCVDESTRTTNRCVLSRTSCDPESELYKSPYELLTPVCNGPGVVEIGRCLSDLDDKRCAATESSCGVKSPFYENIDPNCSLVADKMKPDVVRTTFPACKGDYGSDFFQCVLDAEDCLLSENVNYAKWADEWGPQKCHCEDVPTGVCYEPQTGITGKLTAENSFCAVTDLDCPTTHFWMSARDFLSSERATYECRLCDETETGAAPPSYPVGACLEGGASPTSFTPSSFTSCALEAPMCPPGSGGFVSAQRLQDAGLVCPIERTDNWGVCGSSGDPVECTNKDDSCMYDFRFERNNEECDIHGHSESALPTYFSHCAPRTDLEDRDFRDIRCVWDINECDMATERWEEARLPRDWFPGCTCEDVYTGVCKEPTTGEYHCAVSPLGCTDPTSYVPQRMLEERGIDMECQLCAPRASKEAVPVAPTAAPVAPTPTGSMVGEAYQPANPPVTIDRPTLPPIPLQTYPTQAPDWSSSSSSSQYQQQNSLSTGAIIGMAIGAVVVCALIVLIATTCMDGGKKKEPQGETNPQVSRMDNGNEDPDIVIEDLNHDEEPVPPKAIIT